MVWWYGIEFFQNPRSTPVKFNVFVEDDVVTGKTKNGRTTDQFYRIMEESYMISLKLPIE